MVTSQTLRQGLYALVVVSLLGAAGVGAVAQGNHDSGSVTQPKNATQAESGEATAAPAFLQDEIVFRSRPSGWDGLLFGESEPTAAIAIANTNCARVFDGDAPRKTLMVSTRPTREAQKVDVVRHAPETAGLPACPVKLITQTSVADSARGWLITETDAQSSSTGSVVPPTVLTGYRIERIISASGYALLGFTALLVALCGLVWAYAYRSDPPRLLAGQDPKYPVMAGIAGALSAVSAGGTVSWSNMVPGLDLAGVVVAGLVAAVSVAAGETLAASSTGAGRIFWVGHFLRVFGTAVLALLTPFILLHGADIGAAAALAWLLVTVALIAAGSALRPQPSASF